MKTTPIYGMMAEFDSASDLVAAARKTHEAGYRKIDAYSPFPVEELAEAIGFHKNRVPLVTFEMTILFGGIAAVFGMLALNGLPMPYHPVFNVPRFVMATKDRFFLIVFSTDPKYKPAEVRQFLEGLNPRSIS